LHSSFDSDAGGGGAGGGGSLSNSLGNSRDVLGNSREALAPIRNQGGGHSSGSASPLAKLPSFNATPLGNPPPLGGPLARVPPLGSPSASLSASGSDWPALNAAPQHLGTLKVCICVCVLMHVLGHNSYSLNHGAACLTPSFKACSSLLPSCLHIAIMEVCMQLADTVMR